MLHSGALRSFHFPTKWQLSKGNVSHEIHFTICTLPSAPLVSNDGDSCTNSFSDFLSCCSDLTGNFPSRKCIFPITPMPHECALSVMFQHETWSYGDTTAWWCRNNTDTAISDGSTARQVTGEIYIFDSGVTLEYIPSSSPDIVSLFELFIYIWLGSFEDLWHEIQPLRGLINRCNVTKQDLNMSLQVNDLLTDKRIISYHIISVISSLLVYKLGFNKVRSAVHIIFTHTGCEKLKPVDETQKKHQRCHQ